MLRYVITFAIIFAFVSNLYAKDNYMESFRKGKINEGGNFFHYQDENIAGCKSCIEARKKAMNHTDGKVSGITIRQPVREKEYLQDLARKNLDHKVDTKPAQKTVEAYENNQEMQNTISTYQRNIWEKIQQELDTPEGEKWGAGISSDQIMRFIEKNRNRATYENVYVYIFISSSMPDTTIRNTMRLTDGDPRFVYVLRGVIGDGKYMKPTLDYITWLTCHKRLKDLLESDSERCLKVNVDINPVLFRKFHIDRVPAIVYVPDPLSHVGCEKEITENDYYVFYGNAGLLYCLDAIQRAIGRDDTLDDIRLSLRKSFYR